MDTSLHNASAARARGFSSLRRIAASGLATVLVMAAVTLISGLSCMAQTSELPPPLEDKPIQPPSVTADPNPLTAPATNDPAAPLTPAPSTPAPAPITPPPAPDPTAGITDKENLLFLNTTAGRIVIHMRPDLAPQHVERIKELVRKKFYNGKIFHRVIEGFVAQGGDPEGTGRGGSGQRIPAEFTNTPFIRGVLGMARIPDDVNSADSQFFICYRSLPDLNGQYTVWGEVVAGMDVAEALRKGEPPTNPDAITSAELPWDKPPAPVSKKDKEKTKGDKSKNAAASNTTSTDSETKTDKTDKTTEKKDSKKPGDVPVAQPVNPVTTDKPKDDKKKAISTPRTTTTSSSNSKSTSSSSKGR